MKEKNNNKKERPVVSILDQGRIQPQSVNLEEGLLGSIMIEPNALINVIDFLNPDAFYREAHRIIYVAIIELFKKSEPTDVLSVTNQLKSTGDLELVGGSYYLSQLTNVGAPASVEYYSGVILQKFIQRELIRISGEIIKDAFEDTTDVFDLLDVAQKSLLEINNIIERKQSEILKAVGEETLQRIIKIKYDESGGWGIKSGITILDTLTRGFQSPDFIIIASRPGMGKTALMVTIARKVGIIDKIPMAIFSLEMSSSQLCTRLMTQESGVSYMNLSGGKFNDETEELLTGFVNNLPETFIIDDTPALTLLELRAKCIRLKLQHDIKIIFIDYLQLMSGSKEKGINREQQISEISRGIKALAKELEIPIIALAQLSRLVEQRGGDHRPKLSDLRESGMIEANSDMVIFIYRAAYYFNDDKLLDKNIETDESELLIGKHRNGSTGAVKTRWVKKTMIFEDFYKDVELDENQVLVDFTGDEKEKLPF